MIVANSVASSSLSDSVPLVVDETPMVQTESATGLSVHSTCDKQKAVEVTTETENETITTSKDSEQPSTAVLRLVESSKKITENVENLIESDTKNVNVIILCNKSLIVLTWRDYVVQILI